MVGRIQIKPVIILLLAVAVSACSSQPVSEVQNFRFQKTSINTSRSTCQVFKNVRLGHGVKIEKNGNVLIQDTPGDKDFPELQLYFRTQASGVIKTGFEFKIQDSYEPINIALAGPGFFRLAPNGIAVWLKTNKGFLYQYSDSMPKKLFRPLSGKWYAVSIDYRLDTGRYDLLIRQLDPARTVVRLVDQKNSTDSAKSAVNKLSFVGDVEWDRGRAVYDVRNVEIERHAEIAKKQINIRECWLKK